MSPKNQVHPLSALCVKLLSAKLIQALSDDEGRSYGDVEAYLFDATYEVLQELLRNILKSLNLDAATRFSCLQILLRQDVRKVETGTFPHSYYEAILKVLSQKGVGLQQINLKGVWVREFPVLLSELIRRLKKIKVLIIPHMADDEILKAAAKCELLSTLDISGECNFTSKGLLEFTHKTLTTLDIGSFGKQEVCQNGDSIQIITSLIENLPNLTKLRTYSFTGHALLVLYKKNCTKYKTKLKYLHDTNTTIEIIEAIINLCENLESIHLDSPENSVICRLNQLKKLHSLKLIKYKNEDLFRFLEMSGFNIETLNLNRNNATPLNLCDICLNAPNLQTLDCYKLNITFLQEDFYFMCLENVEILYCDISDESLKRILLNSPFLKRVIVGCVINMTDGDIFRLCAECDFLCLEELWFSCARGLTATSVELLMGHCPILKVIGQLNGWDIHQEELDYLRSVILYTNTDLTLLPLGAL